jgi:Na+(H+)/acetate symporter ActP
MGASAIFPLENPGIVSIPLSLAVTVALSVTGERQAQKTA